METFPASVVPPSHDETHEPPQLRIAYDFLQKEHVSLMQTKEAMEMNNAALQTEVKQLKEEAQRQKDEFHSIGTGADSERRVMEEKLKEYTTIMEEDAQTIRRLRLDNRVLVADHRAMKRALEAANREIAGFKAEAERKAAQALRDQLSRTTHQCTRLISTLEDRLADLKATEFVLSDLDTADVEKTTVSLERLNAETAKEQSQFFLRLLNPLPEKQLVSSIPKLFDFSAGHTEVGTGDDRTSLTWSDTQQESDDIAASLVAPADPPAQSLFYVAQEVDSTPLLHSSSHTAPIVSAPEHEFVGKKAPRSQCSSGGLIKLPLVSPAAGGDPLNPIFPPIDDSRVLSPHHEPVPQNELKIYSPTSEAVLACKRLAARSSVKAPEHFAAMEQRDRVRFLQMWVLRDSKKPAVGWRPFLKKSQRVECYGIRALEDDFKLLAESLRSMETSATANTSRLSILLQCTTLPAKVQESLVHLVKQTAPP